MPDRYAVIGNPVAHSKSPQIHAAFARSTGQDMIYERLLAPLDGFAATLEQFARAGGLGANVTLPFKLEAFAIARDRSERAQHAGACNTLAWRGTHWFGDNTDGVGVVQDLAVNLHVELAGRDILILGAGGAAHGIIEPLLAARPRSLTICNRTFVRAEEIVGHFAASGPIAASAIPEIARRRFDLVIDATSARLSALPGDDADVDLPWPEGIFARGSLAYDLKYANEPTPFLHWARRHGAARAVDGLGMLIEQAAESFLLWRGVRPDTAPLFALLRE